MKTKISALIDGELDPREIREVCIALRHDKELRSTCGAYVLIGDALRREPFLATELSGAVLDHLADEPVVLAPRGMTGYWHDSREWRRPLALAATVAGVAVVAWLGLSTPAGLRGAQVVEKKPVVLASASDADMQEYLIAHQIYSGSISLNGDAQHIRSVSLHGAESRR